MKLLVEEQWESFAAACLHPESPSIQYEEMRRAFYAGFAGLMGILRGIDDSVAEEDGCKIMQSIDKELIEFGEMVMKGER